MYKIFQKFPFVSVKSQECKKLGLDNLDNLFFKKMVFWKMTNVGISPLAICYSGTLDDCNS